MKIEITSHDTSIKQNKMRERVIERLPQAKKDFFAAGGKVQKCGSGPSKTKGPGYNNSLFKKEKG